MTPDYTRSRRIDRPQAQDVVQARGWAPSAYTPMPRATPAASCRAQRRTVAAAAPSAESASFVCAWSGRVRTRHQGRHRRAGAPPSVLCFCRLSSQTTSSSQALRLCRTAAGDMAAQPNDCRRRAGGAGCMPSWWARTLRRAADRRDRSDKGAHARSDAGVQAAHSEKPMRLAPCQQPMALHADYTVSSRPSESPQCYAMVEPARISAVWRYRQTLPAFVSEYRSTPNMARQLLPPSPPEPRPPEMRAGINSVRRVVCAAMPCLSLLCLPRAGGELRHAVAARLPHGRAALRAGGAVR
jgi:hypothetical protein